MSAADPAPPDVIAVDGPAASGKSTVSRRVAEALGRLYVDSGALYRAVTWKALSAGIDPTDGEAVAALAGRMSPEFFTDGAAVRFRVDGIVLDRELRTEAINRNVSPVAATERVRRSVVAWLRRTPAFGPLVMEGRDIGTAVFPDARHKFYLDASPEERARRRHAEMAAQGDGLSVDQVGRSIGNRDRIDSGRKTAPLKTAPDAVVIDSTGLTIEQAVHCIVARVAGAP